MTRKPDQINWGIIGCGNVTEVKSGPAFNKVDGSSLIAVMRRNREKLLDYATRHSVPKTYECAEALIHDPDVDAIYVATPPGSHREYALKVAAANKHCCLEKPMALNFAECQDIIAAFEKTDAQLFVAYYRRSLPRFNKVKAWLDAGKIGTVRHINWHFSRPPSRADLSSAYDWRTDPQVAGGGHFVDLACHGLDLFMYLLGDITEARGIARNQQNLYDAEDAVSACWAFGSGAMGSGFWNFGARESVDEVVIHGSEGAIRFSVFDQQPLILDATAGSEMVEIDHPENIQYFHIENMIQHLKGGRRHPSLGTDACRVSWVMDRILAGSL
ncbi:Gfo/Idh/MocA family oxidoreductase [Microbulbifer sp.]|uniref:Gfo/Idh/MocA family protein n=1 Tax=Microbulbifer sp. TaxID=1908541 RepID=UPI0025856712|nr:Gfo/Idh/MocA family oxidoreductase [Microbulbifer sp.]